MLNQDKTLDSLVSGGLIGAALGLLLSKDKEEGMAIGGILGAAISATMKANQEAKKTKIPVYIKENSKIFAVDASGNKRFIKRIEKPTQNFSGQFKLK